MLGEDGLFTEYEKPCRKYWVKFLSLIGENLPDRHNLPRLDFSIAKD